MLDSVRNFLVSLDYGDDYIALWASASIFFSTIALGPAAVYLLFFADIDKSVKTAIRGPSSRDRDPDDPENERRRRSGSRRRKKRRVSRRLLTVHLPILLALLAIGSLSALGLTRLLSSI